MTARAYTVASLAEAWGCSEGVIRKLIANGELGCFRIYTLIRIPSEEVARFECQNTPSSDSEAASPSSIETQEGNDTDSSWARETARERRLKHAGFGSLDGAAILNGPWSTS